MIIQSNAKIVQGSCSKTSTTCTYNLDTETGILTISGQGETPDYSKFTDRPWNHLSDKIKTIIISEGITKTASFSFSYLKNLQSVKLPSSLNELKTDSFRECPLLTSVTFSEGLQIIGMGCFMKCISLKSITLPSTITLIDSNAFYQCFKLQSINIPKNTNSISSSAFVSCTSLKSFIVNSENTYFSNDENGVLFDSSKTKLLRFPNKNGVKSYTVPSSVTTICKNAFQGLTELEYVNLPTQLTTIEVDAFDSCEGLKEITIPSSVTSLESEVFNNCKSMQKYIVDNSHSTLTVDENGILYNKDKSELLYYPAGKYITEFTIPESVITIKDYAFSSSQHLKKVIIPSNVQTLNKYAFAYSLNLEYVIFSNGAKKIDSSAFRECHNLKEITLPGSLESLQSNSFYLCSSLSSFKIDGESNYISIDEYGVLFNKDKTKLMNYPIGNKRISYTIPASVTSFQDYCFYNSSNLQQIFVEEGSQTYKHDTDGVVYSHDMLTLVQYPIGHPRTHYEIAKGVSIIGIDAFSYSANLLSITIPESVSNLKEYSFFKNNYLQSVVFLRTDGDITFSSNAFGSDFKGNFYSSTDITFPLSNGETKATQKIDGYCGANSFYVIDEETNSMTIISYDDIDPSQITTDLNTITDITINGLTPSNMDDLIQRFPLIDKITVNTKTIGKGFFRNRNHTSIVIGSGVVSIEERAFENCVRLESIQFDTNSQLKSIGDNAFKGCSKLSSIIFPSSLETINFRKTIESSNPMKILFETDGKYEEDENIIYSNERKVIEYHSNKKEISQLTIVNSVEEIADNVFASSDIKSIQFSKSLKRIGRNAFYHNSHIETLVFPPTLEIIESHAFAFCMNLTNVVITSPNIVIRRGAFIGLTKTVNFHFMGDSIVVDDNSLPKNYNFYVSSKYEKDKITNINVLQKAIKSYGSCGDLCNYIITTKDEKLLTIYSGIEINTFDTNHTEDFKLIKQIEIANGPIKIHSNIFSVFENIETITLSYTLQYISTNAFSNNHLVEIFIAREKSFTCEENVFGEATNVHISISYNPNDSLYNKSIIFCGKVFQPKRDYGFCNQNTNNGYDNCKWIYWENWNGERELLIYGKSSMIDYELSEETSKSTALWTKYNENITTIEIRSSTIGNYAFYNTKNLKNITIENGVSSFGNYCFANCESLVSISIPASVTSIGNNVFDGDKLLTSITYMGLTPPECGNNENLSSVKITVPSSYQSGSKFCNVDATRQSNGPVHNGGSN